MKVFLPPDLARWVTEKIEAGQYETASEAVSDGLRLLVEADASREQRLAKFRGDIQAGLDELDAGARIPGDQVLAEVMGRVDARRS